MSVVKFLKELGLHKDPDIQPRLQEIDRSLKRLKDKTPISSNEMMKYVNDNNPDVNLAVLRRRKTSDVKPHHLEVLLDHPDDDIASHAMYHPAITTELLEKQLDKLTKNGRYATLPAGSQYRVDELLSHPKTSMKMLTGMMPQHDDDFVMPDHIHKLFKRKDTPTELLRKGVNLKPEQVWDEPDEDVFRTKKISQPGYPAWRWESHKRHLYSDLVHHPNATGDLLEGVFKDPYVLPKNERYLYTAAASHPAATPELLHMIASRPNFEGKKVVGAYFNRDFVNSKTEPLKRLHSHVAVAQHPNTSPETLTMLSKKRSNSESYMTDLRRALIKHKNTPADVKAKLKRSM